MNNYGLFITT